MGGAIAGALGGLAAVPAEWVEQVGTASRTDLVAPGRTIAAVAAGCTPTTWPGAGRTRPRSPTFWRPE